MFTGIIEELGMVERIRRIGRNTLLELITDVIFQDLNLGDSVAVNGVCLTVTKKHERPNPKTKHDKTLRV